MRMARATTFNIPLYCPSCRLSDNDLQESLLRLERLALRRVPLHQEQAA